METKKKKLKMTRSVSTSIAYCSSVFYVLFMLGFIGITLGIMYLLSTGTGTLGAILLVSSLVFTIINFVLSKLVSGLFVIVSACELYSAINEQKFDIEIVNEIEEEE